MERHELEKLLESSDTVVMPRGLVRELDDADTADDEAEGPAENDH